MNIRELFRQARTKLVVLRSEIGGRWSEDASAWIRLVVSRPLMSSGSAAVFVPGSGSRLGSAVVVSASGHCAESVGTAALGRRTGEAARQRDNVWSPEQGVSQKTHGLGVAYNSGDIRV